MKVEQRVDSLTGSVPSTSAPTTGHLYVPEHEEAQYVFRAVTRGVSPKLSACELTFCARETIDIATATTQLDQYVGLLRRWGVEIHPLPGSNSYPDCCFVQDTAVVLDEVCIIASMGALSRRDETVEVEKLLSLHRPIRRISLPATLDGGDVVQFDRRLFTGISTRTNARGIQALMDIVEPHGYEVVPVKVSGSLHLTTGCGIVNDETVLLNPQWVDPTPFRGLRRLFVPEAEPWAANTIRVDDAVCIEADAPQTADLLHPQVEFLESVDISEFRKAEGSLSCLSLLFKEPIRNAN